MLFGISWDAASDGSLMISILPILLHGLIVTLEATVVGFVFAMLFGLVLAGLKSVPLKLIRWPAKVISEFLRDTPLLVQLFFLYYVLPEYGLSLPAFMTGALALGLQYSAYLSEVFRGGLEAISQGQREAARALALKPLTTFIQIMVPQAFPRIIPAAGNYLVSIMKDVPILSVVTVIEMFGAAKIIADQTFNYLVPLSMVGVIYLIMTLLSNWLIKRLDKHLPKWGAMTR